MPDTISARLIAVQARVAEVVKRTEDEFLKTELQELGRRINDARLGIVTFLEQSAEGHVYWVERTGKAAQFLTLNAAPIDIAPVLERMLFRENCSCVLTSATLAVGRPDLAYFRDRIGAGSVEPLQLGSPFDFPTQMKLFVVRKMPDPRDVGLRQGARALGRAFRDGNGRTRVCSCSPAIAECSSSPKRCSRSLRRTE